MSHTALPVHGAEDNAGLRRKYYALFAASGVAGLIYESIWTQYLKLFLGHAAYAQSLVLVIFMGGMALGAWQAGRFSNRLSRPLVAYAVVEVLLGIGGLAFDSLFRGMQAYFFGSLVPALASPAAIDLWKWSLSALLILPQSILLGATFPLMSAGVLRLAPAQTGSGLAWLYFTNSVGASTGMLLSGFFLIDHVGLPGTLFTAGLINFTLAAAVYGYARRSTAVAAPPSATTQAAVPVSPLLLAALLTGAASFFYEIGWIRMLSLVLGSTTHSFELMLSVFILGLALGSLWVRHRIDAAADPVKLLGRIQLLMASLALVSLPLYMQSFEVMAATMQAVKPNAGGYAFYTLVSYAICFGLMLPATFCAGMTLPLITAALVRAGAGEASIGRVYACNTVGAILGVLVAVHVVMPWAGLRQVVVTGAAIDLLLGLWLLRGTGFMQQRMQVALAAIAGISLVIALATRFDPAVTASGAYRGGQARTAGEVLFHADGKTATVDVIRHDDGTVSISTNGKVDAGFNAQGKRGPDDYTMILLGLLPMSMNPQGTTAAVIGFGSGTTTHTVLYNPKLKAVDTIEIEPAVIEGARFFGDSVAGAYSDPRGRIHVEDAKTFFALSGQRYDFILSEPSNPWVSGIASLFSKEFYEQSKRYLSEDGLFVQWLHLYEINLPLIATVMNALGESFADYAVYANNADDIMIVASPSGRLPSVQDGLFQDSAFRPPLERLGMRSAIDFRFRELGTKATLQPYFASVNPVVNSDYFPELDQGAARQRFLSEDARGFQQIHPYSLRLEGRAAQRAADLAAPLFFQPVPGIALQARAWAAYVLDSEQLSGLNGSRAAHAEILRQAMQVCGRAVSEAVMVDALWDFVSSAAYYLPVETVTAIVRGLRNSRCAALKQPVAVAWIDLLEGMGLAQVELVRSSVARLWPMLQGDVPAAQFVIAELLLAELLAGDAGRALETLHGISGLPENIPMAYLRANIEARQSQAAAQQVR